MVEEKIISSVPFAGKPISRNPSKHYRRKEKFKRHIASLNDSNADDDKGEDKGKITKTKTTTTQNSLNVRVPSTRSSLSSSLNEPKKFTSSTQKARELRKSTRSRSVGVDNSKTTRDINTAAANPSENSKRLNNSLVIQNKIRYVATSLSEESESSFLYPNPIRNSRSLVSKISEDSIESSSTVQSSTKKNITSNNRRNSKLALARHLDIDASEDDLKPVGNVSNVSTKGTISSSKKDKNHSTASKKEPQQNLRKSRFTKRSGRSRSLTRSHPEDMNASTPSKLRSPSYANRTLSKVPTRSLSSSNLQEYTNSGKGKKEEADINTIINNDNDNQLPYSRLRSSKRRGRSLSRTRFSSLKKSQSEECSDLGKSLVSSSKAAAAGRSPFSQIMADKLVSVKSASLKSKPSILPSTIPASPASPSGTKKKYSKPAGWSSTRHVIEPRLRMPIHKCIDDKHDEPIQLEEKGSSSLDNNDDQLQTIQSYLDVSAEVNSKMMSEATSVTTTTIIDDEEIKSESDRNSFPTLPAADATWSFDSTLKRRKIKETKSRVTTNVCPDFEEEDKNNIALDATWSFDTTMKTKKAKKKKKTNLEKRNVSTGFNEEDEKGTTIYIDNDNGSTNKANNNTNIATEPVNGENDAISRALSPNHENSVSIKTADKDVETIPVVEDKSSNSKNINLSQTNLEKHTSVSDEYGDPPLEEIESEVSVGFNMGSINVYSQKLIASFCTSSNKEMKSEYNSSCTKLDSEHIYKKKEEKIADSRDSFVRTIEKKNEKDVKSSEISVELTVENSPWDLSASRFSNIEVSSITSQPDVAEMFDTASWVTGTEADFSNLSIPKFAVNEDVESHFVSLMTEEKDSRNLTENEETLLDEARTNLEHAQKKDTFVDEQRMHKLDISNAEIFLFPSDYEVPAGSSCRILSDRNPSLGAAFQNKIDMFDTSSGAAGIEPEFSDTPLSKFFIDKDTDSQFVKMMTEEMETRTLTEDERNMLFEAREKITQAEENIRTENKIVQKDDEPLIGKVLNSNSDEVSTTNFSVPLQDRLKIYASVKPDWDSVDDGSEVGNQDEEENFGDDEEVEMYVEYVVQNDEDESEGEGENNETEVISPPEEEYLIPSNNVPTLEVAALATSTSTAHQTFNDGVVEIIVENDSQNASYNKEIDKERKTNEAEVNSVSSKNALTASTQQPNGFPATLESLVSLPPPPPPPGVPTRKKAKKNKYKSNDRGKSVPLLAPPPTEKVKKWEDDQKRARDFLTTTKKRIAKTEPKVVEESSDYFHFDSVQQSSNNETFEIVNEMKDSYSLKTNPDNPSSVQEKSEFVSINTIYGDGGELETKRCSMTKKYGETQIRDENKILLTRDKESQEQDASFSTPVICETEDDTFQAQDKENSTEDVVSSKENERACINRAEFFDISQEVLYTVDTISPFQGALVKESGQQDNNHSKENDTVQSVSSTSRTTSTIEDTRQNQGPEDISISQFSGEEQSQDVQVTSFVSTPENNPWRNVVADAIGLVERLEGRYDPDFVGIDSYLSPLSDEAKEDVPFVRSNSLNENSNNILVSHHNKDLIKDEIINSFSEVNENDTSDASDSIIQLKKDRHINVKVPESPMKKEIESSLFSIPKSSTRPEKPEKGFNEKRKQAHNAEVIPSPHETVSWFSREVLKNKLALQETDIDVSKIARSLLETNDQFNYMSRYVAESINEVSIELKPSLRFCDSVLSSFDEVSTSTSVDSSVNNTYDDSSENKQRPLLKPVILSEVSLKLNSKVLAANFVSFVSMASNNTKVPTPFGDSNPFLAMIVASSFYDKKSEKEIPKTLQELLFDQLDGKVELLIDFVYKVKCSCDSEMNTLTKSIYATEDSSVKTKKSHLSVGTEKDFGRRFKVPQGHPSPFEVSVLEVPMVLVAVLSFLGDPVSVCQIKTVNRLCGRVVAENEHMLMQDAVRTGGIDASIRPAFWMWIALEKCDVCSREKQFNGKDELYELKRKAEEGKWHHVIKRDVLRSFGNMPPHKSGARFRSDSIVTALVPWGQNRITKRGVKVGRKKSHSSPPWEYNEDHCNGDDISVKSEVSENPTDTVSDWGAVSPKGSFVGSVKDNDYEYSQRKQISSSNDISDEDIALNGNSLSLDVKKDLQNKLNFILHSLAATYEDIGYCQGMDYVVAHLLRILQQTIRWKAANNKLPLVITTASTYQGKLPVHTDNTGAIYNEIDSNHIVEETIVRIMDVFFVNYNLMHMYWPELRCLKTCCRVFERLIQIKLPVLADHFEYHDLNVGLFALGWFQTLFLYLPSMPSATVCHMWDIWLVERSFKIFFRVGTALLFLSQPTLLNHDLEGMMIYLNTIPDATLLRSDILIPCALNIKVTNRMLQELEEAVIKNPY